MTNKQKTEALPQRKPRALLTVKDVAVLDACSEKTVRRAIAAGLLEVVRIDPGGRLLRIDPAAHAAYRASSNS
jgi:excisionase family DNA binding protein